MTVYSVATLAEHWGCSPDTIYSLITGGELPHFKLGGKLIRIRADEVERYECRQNTPCKSTEEPSPSSGTAMDDAIAIRLGRLIERRPRPQLVHSGTSGR